MKGLILAAGKGTRLKPLTSTIPKHLLPVANKPILFYVLEQLKDAGLTDIGIVVSPETGPDIELAVKNGADWDVKITYVLQRQPLGLAHAVKAATEYLADSPFLLFLGDNLIEDRVKDLVSKYHAHSPDALIVLKEVADPRAFGVAEVDSEGKVRRVVEKPKEPKNNLALVGAYIFTPVIHQAISELKPSWRGEYEITDAIQKLLDMGKNVDSHVLDGWWLDTGKKEDLLEANRTLLEYLPSRLDGRIDSASRISGSVGLGVGSIVENSEIQGPAVIGANCRVIDPLIGPFTSIGDETAAVKYSIVMNNSSILGIRQIEKSVIGRNVEIKNKPAESSAAVLFIGDDARLDI